MLNRKLRIISLLMGILAANALLPGGALAQGFVSRESLDEWFYSRLLWGVFVGAFFGVFVGLVHLCRLQFQIDALHVNSQARRKFAMWSLVILVVGGLLLFLDAWLLFPFSAVSLQFGEALTQVWANYRTLLIIAATWAAFGLAVVVATRMKSDCRCRYAFFPGPHGK